MTPGDVGAQSYGRLWPKLVLSGFVGVTVAVGIGLKVLGWGS